MKKSTRIRPVVESLESMMLLSTAVANLHHLAVAAPAAHVTHVVSAESTVTLAGTLKGTGKISGTTATVSGSGNLGKVGTTTFKLKVDALAPPSSVTLSTKKGNLYLAADSALISTGSTSGSTTYSITGGTKAYANATGSGTVTASYTLAKGKLSLTIHLS